MQCTLQSFLTYTCHLLRENQFPTMKWKCWMLKGISSPGQRYISHHKLFVYLSNFLFWKTILKTKGLMMRTLFCSINPHVREYTEYRKGLVSESSESWKLIWICMAVITQTTRNSLRTTELDWVTMFTGYDNIWGKLVCRNSNRRAKPDAMNIRSCFHRWALFVTPETS